MEKVSYGEGRKEQAERRDIPDVLQAEYSKKCI